MANSNLRPPVAAGRFYPDDAAELKKELKTFLGRSVKGQRALGCLVPHAGYMYSGAVAGAVFSRLAPADTVIMFGPNHTGLGTPFSLMSRGAWQTPLGEVAIDERLSRELLDASSLLADDSLAHLREHSLEVEAPFLKFIRPDVSIVPCIVASQNLDDLRTLGQTVAQVIKRLPPEKNVLVLASSDMTHYEPDASARKKDASAIEAMLALDTAALAERVSGADISMCGFSPAVIMIEACLGLGATKAELIDYKTSGDASGDRSSVVGYAGIIVS